MSKIGFVIMCLGVMMADSDNLLIPLGVLAVGVILIVLGMKRETQR